ncbi:MAG: hypothetical protein EBT99_17100 [Betaproteobacteria bacterium]|nr:hypothetical protein [Betaproteobacteria bacterium]
MKGINKNGVIWVKQGNRTTCFYNLSSDVEISKTFVNMSVKAIQNLTGTQLLNVQKNNIFKEQKT